MGHQTWFLPMAPFNLGTSLLVHMQSLLLSKTFIA